MNLENKINIVKNILKDKKVAIGFSGGADSTLLAYLSSKVADDTLVITIDNHILPTGFVENTKKVAESFKIQHEIIDIDFYQNKDFISNDSCRCYRCRMLMYDYIEKIAHKNGFDFICDGNNISDLVIDRPGILVTYDKGFKTPFIDAKLTSKEIHQYLNENNIRYSKSTTCLATRIPTNTQTTKEKINKIRNCEDYISSKTNCKIVKVRDLGNLGVVEVDNINEIMKNDKFKQINTKLKEYGFQKVTVNLSEIDDDEFISINYTDGVYSYQLPFTINLEKTKNQIKTEIINESNEKIEINKNIIYKNGLIEGYDYNNYQDALNNFMELLPNLRRNIR